jgi:hypothetical protein
VSDVEVRAGNARALKENPLLAEIIEQVKAEAVQAWLQTPAQEGQQAREFAWMLHKAMGRFESVIQGAIDDGVVAAKRAAAPLR